MRVEMDTAVNFGVFLFLFLSPRVGWVQNESVRADINRQSCKVLKCIAKTRDESHLASKMLIELTDSITTFGFELFPRRLLHIK